MSPETTTNAAPAVARHLRPTMLIALGGSGKDVLLRVRRLFWERHGTRGYPIIGYLAVDTDGPALKKLQGDNPSDFVLRNIHFQEGGTPEAINCSIEPAAFEAFFRGGQREFPHIFRWMPLEMKNYGSTAVVAGAGLKRPFGRLAFFHHFRKIKAALTARINHIMQYATRPELVRQWQEPGIEIDPNQLEIVIVYSLAGGTGAGMFLDMGMLARQIVQDELKLGVTAHILHYAILPEGFVQNAREDQEGIGISSEDQRERSQANAFAALREMEFFSMEGQGKRLDLSIPSTTPESEGTSAQARYQVQWERDGKVYDAISAPWDIVYLVGGNNDEMEGHLLPPDTFQMIAENIFLDFDPNQFGVEKRSRRNNDMDQITTGAMHDPVRDDRGDVLFRTYASKRFSIFGLSQMYVDRARMRRAAGHRLAWRLLFERWLRQTPLSPVELGEMAMKDIAGSEREGVVTETGFADDPKLSLTYKSLFGQIMLEDVENDRQRTWWMRIEEEAAAIRQQIEDGEIDPMRDEPVSAWLQKRMQGLARRREELDVGEIGRVVRSFRHHRELLEPRIETRLRSLFRFRIKDVGLPGTLRLLEEYGKLHGVQVQKAQQYSRQKPPFPADWQDRLRDARRVPVPFFYPARAARNELLRAVDQVRDYLKAAFHHEAVEEIRACLDLVETRISRTGDKASLASSLRRITDTLSNPVLRHLGARFEELRTSPDRQTRTVGLLTGWHADEYDTRINRLLTPTKHGKAIDWPDVEERVFAKLQELEGGSERWAGVKGLPDLVMRLVDLERRGLPIDAELDRFVSDLVEACEGLLEGFADDVRVLDEFDKEPDKQAIRLSYLRQYSAPFLRFTGNQNLPPDANPVATKYLGIANSTSPQAVEFRQKLVREGARAVTSLVGLQTFSTQDDAVVLYQQKAGIPLCYYAGLQKLGEVYDRYEKKRQLHFDYRNLLAELPEIRLVDQQAQQHLDSCVQWTLLGIMTRVLHRDNEQFHLVREDMADLSFPVGSQLEEVVYHCADREDTRHELQRQVEEWIAASKRSRQGARLAVLWCAAQDLADDIQRRVQLRINAAPERAREPIPVLLKILNDRILPLLRNHLAGIAGGPRWLESKLDARVNRKLPTREERQKAERDRRAMLANLYHPLSEAMPIPVLEPEATLDPVKLGMTRAPREESHEQAEFQEAFWRPDGEAETPAELEMDPDDL